MTCFNKQYSAIQIRRGSSSQFISSNQILASGEPAYSIDSKEFKIGDGITNWINLPALIASGSLLQFSPISSSGLALLITDETGSGLAVFNNSPLFTGIPLTPTAISGTNTNQIASTAFVRTEISNLVDSAPVLLDTLNEIAAAINDDANFATTIASGLANKAPLIHTHISTDITDFNSSVSGLLPVKDIVAGTDINVSSISGIYTINSSNTISTDTLEPDGFVNRTDSIISFNDGSRQFSISPKSPATSYSIYNNGIKVVKNSTESTTLPDTTALYFIHFDKSNNNLSYKTTGFDFDTDIPIAHIYYNADDNKAVYFGEERHGIRMDASTHRYLHNVFGTQYVNGLSISNYTIGGNGSNNSDATIAIGDGLIYDEDIEANITHSNTPSNPFEQVLYPIAQIPVYYKVGSNGAWTDTTANNYPVKTGTTIQYNLNSAGTWSASNSNNPTNNRYISYWICATTQENAPIISIMGQRIDSSLEQATSNNSWSNLDLTGLPIVELRPLYRLIYDTKSTFTNTPKGFLADVLDIRSHIDTVTGLTQNDHGNLYGLADDDHYQYVHIDNARTIDAIHTFSNGLVASGLISGTSGNFTNGLYINNNPVSISGHTHTSSNISDFNSAVSGLLPSVSGSGYVVSSFNNANNRYTVSVTGLQPSGNYSLVGHSHSIYDGTLPDIVGLVDDKEFVIYYPEGASEITILGHLNTLATRGLGNISASGTIGSTSGLLVTTSTGGLLSTSSGITSSYITNFNSSVSGLMVYATQTEAFTGSASAVVMSPIRVRDWSKNWKLVNLSEAQRDITNTNSTGSVSLDSIRLIANNNFNTANATSVYRSWSFNFSQSYDPSGGNAGGLTNWSWSKPLIFAFRLTAGPVFAENGIARIQFGKRTLNTLAQLDQHGIGLEIRGVSGGGNPRLWTLAHNGTSLTQADTGVNLVLGKIYDIVISSNGSGTVTTMVNDTDYTTTGGPTTDLKSPTNESTIAIEATNGSTTLAQASFYFTTHMDDSTMKTPPIDWVDLYALGISANSSISSTATSHIVTPQPSLLMRKLLAELVVRPAPEDDRMAYLRHIRDLLIQCTDWTQTSDSPLTTSQRTAWLEYRQELRDLPQIYSGDGPIPWPTEPT